MDNRRRSWALACVLLLGACGGGADGTAKDAAKDGDATAAGTDQSPEGETTTTTAASGGSAGQGATTTTANRGITVAPSPKKGDPTTTTLPPEQQQPTPLQVTLEKSCVRAGGMQTITIKAPAGGAAGYDSYYADGKSGISDGFHGGNNGTVMPADGTWTDTWTVSPGAPSGKVKVIVQAVKMGFKATQQEHFYDLVGPAGTCP